MREIAPYHKTMKHGVPPVQKRCPALDLPVPRPKVDYDEVLKVADQLEAGAALMSLITNDR